MNFKTGSYFSNAVGILWDAFAFVMGCRLRTTVLDTLVNQVKLLLYYTIHHCMEYNVFIVVFIYF